MTAITAHPLLTSAADRRCGKAVRGIEKAGARQQFHSECQTPRESRTIVVAAPALRPPCQFGTNQDAPFWNGPRLRPSFAAQVLGQAMATRAPGASAYAAYRTAAVRAAPIFDEDI